MKLEEQPKVNNQLHKPETTHKQVVPPPAESPLPNTTAIEEKKDINEEPLQFKNRGFGVTLLLFQVGFMVVYGLNGSYYSQFSSTPTSFYEVLTIVMSGLFTIVGFGLVLSVYKWGSWLGLASAVFVFAVSAQIGPLFQQLWHYVFLSSYIEPNSNFIYENTTTNISKFFDHHRAGTKLKIMLSSYIYQVVFLSCVSILTLMTAVVGRLSLPQLFKIAVAFQFFWNLNFFLNIYLCVIRNYAIKQPYVFDSYGSSYNYLFAACFGLFFTVLVNRQLLPSNHMRNVMDGYSWWMSTIGTGLIFANFVFSQNYLIVSPTAGENYKRFSIFFALIGSIIGTFIGSAFANKGFVGLKQILIGTITGGVTVGSAASYTSNIGVVIMIGSVGGLFSGLLTRPIHKTINKHFMYDNLGLFVPFLVCSLFGSLVVPCSVLAWDSDRSLQNLGIRSVDSKGGYDGYPYTEIAYQLIYAGVSAAIGLGGGALTGLFCRFDNDQFGLAANARLFINDFGLYAPKQQVYEEKKDNQPASQSKERLSDQ